MPAITTKEAHAVMSQVGPAMRGLTKHAQALEQENATLREKVARYELEKRATALASELDRRGVNDQMDLQSKVAQLMSEPELLPVREEAVKIASPQQLLGQLGDEDHAAGGKSQLESFVLDEE